MESFGSKGNVMKVPMSRFVAIGLLAGLLTAAGLAPAQAAPADRAHAAPTHSVPTQQPTLTRPTSGLGMASSAPPSTSPAVFSCNGKDDIDIWTTCTKCPSGYACAFVCCYQQVNYFFRFYYGGTYSLYYWHDTEELFNHQTSGWTVRTYGQSGGLLHCYPPRTAYYNVDWDPVWSIKLSSHVC
jgi:hypothetical protein